MEFQAAYRPMTEVATTGNALVDLLSLVEQGASRYSIRAAIKRLEEVMAELPQVEQPVKHHFAPGLYGREIFNPKDSLIVTKEHKQGNISFLLSGTLGVITEEGSKTITAPAMFETFPGTKRVLYAQTDVIFATVHPNPSNTDNLLELEAGIIAGGTDEVGATKPPILEVSA